MGKRVLINIFLILSVFLFLEFISFKLTDIQNKKFMQLVEKSPLKQKNKFETRYQLFEKFNTKIYNPSYFKENSPQKPILWFGCSFAEGAGLKEYQVPCLKLSNLSNRTCYNRSKGATGTQFMFWQLNQENIKQEAPEVEYIIYVFIWDHLYRLHRFQINPLIYMHNLRYEIKNGELKEVIPTFNPIYSSYFVQKLLNKRAERLGNKETLDFKLFNSIMKNAVKISKEKYPNSKFIMIEFPDSQGQSQFPQSEIQTLESYGITVVNALEYINVPDVFAKELWLADEIHPTSELWDLFLPKFVENHIK